MANKFIIPAPPVVGVAAGATATLDLSIGPRYHVIWLETTGTLGSGTTAKLSAFLGLLKLKVNGRVQRQMTAIELNAINMLNEANLAARIYNSTAPNTLYGTVDADGNLLKAGSTTIDASQTFTIRIPICLAEPFRKQYAAADAMAWPTSWPGGKGLIGTFQLEAVCGAATSPALNAKVEIDYQLGVVDANGNPVLQINKWSALDTAYASGDNYITTLPRSEVYQQISFFTTTQTVDSLKVKVENNLIRDLTKATNDSSLVARGMNSGAISTTQFHCVFDYDDLPTSALPMVYNGKQVQDFQVIPSLSAAGSGMRVLYQTFGPLA